MSSRLELVQVESDVLLAEEPHGAAHQPRFDLVTAFTLAAERHLGMWRGIDTGVGASIADKGTVTGLVNASSGDTITFNLYNNPNGTGPALFTVSTRTRPG